MTRDTYHAFGDEWLKFDALMIVRQRLYWVPALPSGSVLIGANHGPGFALLTKQIVDFQEKHRSIEERMPSETTCSHI